MLAAGRTRRDVWPGPWVARSSITHSLWVSSERLSTSPSTVWKNAFCMRSCGFGVRSLRLVPCLVDREGPFVPSPCPGKRFRPRISSLPPLPQTHSCTLPWGSPSQNGNILVGTGIPLGLRVSSCLTLGNEFSQETQVPTRQEASLGRIARGARRTALPCGAQSRA